MIFKGLDSRQTRRGRGGAHSALCGLQALGLTLLELAQMLEEGEYIDEPSNLAFALAVGRGCFGWQRTQDSQ